MLHLSLRLFRAGLIVVIVNLYSTNCLADVLSQKMFIDIKASSLSLTLNQIAKLYNTSFVADANTLQTLYHPTIRGSYTLEQLLTTLFTKHHIDFTLVANGIVLSKKVSVDNASSYMSDNNNDHDIENILVVGSRLFEHHIETIAANQQNLTDGLIAQYNSDQLADYIGYNGLTALPNLNVAEAIGYLPGVSISRFFGEGLTVNSRGLGPLFQNTSLNGHLLAINENVRNSGQSGRAFRFDVLPVQNIAQINLVKSPTAEMADASIGSSVAIETFKPLKFQEEQFIGSFHVEYGDKSHQLLPQSTWFTNWLNDDHDLGVVFTGSYSKRFVQQESLQTWDWELNGNSYSVKTLPDDVLLPSNRVALTLEQEQRKNLSLGVAMQWQVDDQLMLTMDHFYSQLDASFNEQRLLSRLDQSNKQVGNIKLANNVLVGANFPHASFKTALETSSPQNSNYIGIFDVNWQQKKWLLNLSVAYSVAESMTDEPIRRTRFMVQPQSFSFFFPENLTNKGQFNVAQFPVELSDFSSVEHASTRFIDVNDNGLSSNVSLSRDLTLGIFDQLIFGYQWRQQTRKYLRQDLALDPSKLEGIEFTSEHFQKSTTEIALSSLQPQHARWLSPSLFIQQEFNQQLSVNQFTSADLANSYQLNETTQASFIQLNYQFDVGFPISGNLGSRWWHWQADVSGINRLNMHRNDDFLVLPNFAVNMKFSPQWQFKFSLANTLSLPSYADLNPSVTLNSTDGVLLARGGNPKLRPIRASQWDSGLFWYFSEQANVSVGYFQKNIDDLILRRASLTEFNGENYRFTQPINAGKAKVSGWEFAYNQNFLTGFGVQYNLTLIDSEVSDDSFVDMPADNVPVNDLEGVSKLSYNLLAFYEVAPWVIRLGFDYRGEYLESLSVTDVPSTWLNSQQTFKFYLGYQMTDAITLSLSGRNLFTKPYQYYFEFDDTRVVKSIIETEQNFSLGITFKL